MCSLNIQGGGVMEIGMQWKWYEMQLHNFCICLGTDSRPEEISFQRSTVGTPLLSFASLAVLFLWHKWCDTASLHIIQYSVVCKSHVDRTEILLLY